MEGAGAGPPVERVGAGPLVERVVDVGEQDVEEEARNSNLRYFAPQHPHTQ